MGRPSKVFLGKTCAFYIGMRHRVALLEFRKRHGLANDNEALRKILDAVADVEGVDTMGGGLVGVPSEDHESAT